MKTLIRNAALILFAALSTMTVCGQETACDTVSGTINATRVPLVAAGALSVTEGAVGRFTSRQPRHPAENLRHIHGNGGVMTAARFAPLALPWVMKAVGAPVRSSWEKLAVSQAVGAVALAGITESLKRGVDAPRPDGDDRRSFPSGHTAWAFMGATSVLHELGDASPWYAFGAYTFATGVAAQRVLSNRHLPSDAVAGAGIGILSAELGYYVSNLIWPDKKTLKQPQEFDLRNYLQLTTGLLWPVGHIRTSEGSICRLPALEAAVRAGGSLTDRWGLWAAVGLRSQPLQLDMPLGATYVGCLNEVGAMIGAQYTAFSCDRIDVNLETAAGLYGNLNIKTVNDNIKTAKATPVGRLGVALTWHMTSRLSCRSALGWEMSGYKFRLYPSQAYFVAYDTQTSGVTSAVTASLSLVVKL